MKKSEINDVENTELKKVWSRLDEIERYHNSRLICKGTFFLSDGREYFIPIKYAKIDMSDNKVIDFLIKKQSKGMSLIDSLSLLLQVKTEEIKDLDWGVKVNKTPVRYKIFDKGGTFKQLSVKQVKQAYKQGILIKNIFFQNEGETYTVGYNSLHLKEYNKLQEEARLLKEKSGY